MGDACISPPTRAARLVLLWSDDRIEPPAEPPSPYCDTINRKIRTSPATAELDVQSCSVCWSGMSAPHRVQRKPGSPQARFALHNDPIATRLQRCQLLMRRSSAHGLSNFGQVFAQLPTRAARSCPRRLRLSQSDARDSGLRQVPQRPLEVSDDPGRSPRLRRS